MIINSAETENKKWKKDKMIQLMKLKDAKYELMFTEDEKCSWIIRNDVMMLQARQELQKEIFFGSDGRE